MNSIPLPTNGLRSLLTICLALNIYCGWGQAPARDHVADSLRGIYASVTPSGAVYFVNQGELIAIFGRDGRSLTPFSHSSLIRGYKGRFIADQNLMIDSAGRFITRMQGGNSYEYGQPTLRDSQYYYPAYEAQYLYDANGRGIAYLQLYKPWPEVGLATYSISGDCFGIRDTNGRIIFPAERGCQYSIGSTGIIKICRDTAYAYDLRARLRFRAYAHNAAQLERGIVAIKLYNNWSLRDSTGRALTDFNSYDYGYADPKLKWMHLSDDRLTGPAGERPQAGEIISEEPFGWGLYRVQRAGRTTLDIVDEKGRERISGLERDGGQRIGERYFTQSESRPRIFDLRQRDYTSLQVEHSPAAGVYVVFDPLRQERQLYRDDRRQAIPAFTDIAYPGIRRFYVLIRDRGKVRPYGIGEHNGYSQSSEYLGSVAKYGRVYGLADSSLNLVLPLKYSTVNFFSPELIQAFLPADSSTYFFDGRGQEIARVPGSVSVDWRGSFVLVQGAGAALALDRDSGRVVFKGRVLPKILESGSWKRGMPRLLLNGDSTDQPGVYTPDGRRVLAGMLTQEVVAAPGVLRFRRGDSSFFMNAAGTALYGGRGFAATQMMIPMESYMLLLRDAGGRWGAIDAAGKAIYPFRYDTAGAVDPRDWGGRQRYFLENGAERIVMDNAGRILRTDDSTRIKDALRLARSYNGYLLDWLVPDGGTLGLYNGRLQRLSDFGGLRSGENHGDKEIIYDTVRKTAAVMDTNGAWISPVVPMSSRFLFSADHFLIVIPGGRGDQLCTREAGGWRAEPVLIAPRDRKRYLESNSSTTMLAFRTRTGGVGAYWRGRLYRNETADELKDLYEVLLLRRGPKWGMLNAGLQQVQAPTADSIYQTKTREIFGIDSAGYSGLYDIGTGISIPPGYSEFYNPYTLKERFVVARLGERFFVLGPGGTRLTPALDRIRLQNNSLHNIPAVLHGQDAVVTTDRDGVVRIHLTTGPPVLKAGTGKPYTPVVVVAEGGRMGLYSNLVSRYLLPPVYDSVATLAEGFVAWKYRPDHFEGADSTLLFNAEGKLLAAVAGYAKPNQQPGGYWRLNNEEIGPVVTDDGVTLVPAGERFTAYGEELFILGGWENQGIIRSDGVWTLRKCPGQRIIKTSGGSLYGSRQQGIRRRYFFIDASGHAGAAMYRSIREEDRELHFRRGLKRGALDQDGDEISAVPSSKGSF